MAGQGNAAPVIIKRKRIIIGNKGHGGAWKVAYADFVTAMMTFFMLMWLLNATTEKQRKGIADYFNPTIPINQVSGGGDGAFGGDSVFTEDTLARVGTGASAVAPTESHAARGVTQPQTGKQAGATSDPAEVMKNVEKKLIARGGEGETMTQLLKHVTTRVTDEGLVIELFDIKDHPLFKPNTAIPTDLMRSLATLLAQVFAIARNHVAVEGYVKSYPMTAGQDPSWALSEERAGLVHDLMVEAGLDDKRVDRVTGHADRKPAVADRAALRNNRIEVVLIRSDR